MQEIEAKILDIDRAGLEARLVQLGATISFDGDMNALFFDQPGRAISQAGGVLRLRQEGSSTQLTHKRSISRREAKVMEETETSVADFEAMRQILLAVGFEVIKETRKFRRQYDLGGSHVVIDDYQGELAYIPVFAEIEAPSVAALHAMVQQLGYAPEQALSWSTYDLVKHYGPGQV
jgi:adenylate cyclase class 2